MSVVDQVKVTVIIPTLYKNLEHVKLCVESLRQTVRWDIIIASNGDGAAHHRYEGIMARSIHVPKQGQCLAVNNAAQLASPNTEYLLISNDDMYYANDWANNLRFDYPVFSPNLLEPTNNPGSAPPFEKVDGGFTLDEFKQDVVEDKVSELVESERGSEEDGFNFPVFIRKDVWTAIGGYDTKYDPWGSNSDTDLQTKIGVAGITPKRLRDVIVYHFSNKSGTFDGTHQAEWQHNFDYYGRKWGYTRDDEPKGDPWYHKNMVNKKLLRYHPPYEGKYEDPVNR